MSLAIDDRKKERPVWGRWRLIRKTCELEHEGRGHYRVDLEDCGDEAQILAWALHLSQKNWVQPEDLGNFMLAMRDLFGFHLDGQKHGATMSRRVPGHDAAARLQRAGWLDGAEVALLDDDEEG